MNGFAPAPMTTSSGVIASEPVKPRIRLISRAAASRSGSIPAEGV